MSSDEQLSNATLTVALALALGSRWKQLPVIRVGPGQLCIEWPIQVPKEGRTKGSPDRTSSSKASGRSNLQAQPAAADTKRVDSRPEALLQLGME